MPITLSCQCGKTFTVKDELAGRRGKCKACGKTLTIPGISDEPEEEIVVAEVVSDSAPPRALTPSPAPPTSSPFAPMAPWPPPATPEMMGGVEAFLETFVFRPTARMVWPDNCVGCLVPNPRSHLTLRVRPADAAPGSTTGAIVGGLAGGFVGAMVGGAVGAAIGAGLSGPSAYNVPTCPMCLRQLSKGELKALDSGQTRAESRYLIREIDNRSVSICFRRAEYGVLFRRANKERVFESVAELLAAEQAGSEGTAGQQLSAPVAAMIQEAKNLPERVHRVLASFLPKDGLYVAPNIPEKKLRNACMSCRVPPGESVIGLVDCTVFGSAKNCLLFGTQGAYFRKASSDKTPFAGFVPYGDFPTRMFASGGMGEISLGKGRSLDVSGSSMSKKDFLRILQTLQQVVFAGSREDHA